MPDKSMRKDLLNKLLKGVNFNMDGHDINSIIKNLEGYTCSDMKALIKDASMNPLRNISK